MATDAEVSRLLAEVGSTGDPSAEASRLVAEVGVTPIPHAEVSRIVVEVASDYVPDEALLYGDLDNNGNSLSGQLRESSSGAVHELYFCILNSLSPDPPTPPGPPPPPPPPGPNPNPNPPPPGGGGGGGGGGPGGGENPVDRPPGYAELVLVCHEQYLMVLSGPRLVRVGTQFLWI